MMATLEKTQGDKGSRYVWLRGGPHHCQMAKLPHGKTRLVRNTMGPKGATRALYRMSENGEMLFDRLLKVGESF